MYVIIFSNHCTYQKSVYIYMNMIQELALTFHINLYVGTYNLSLSFINVNGFIMYKTSTAMLRKYSFP